MRALRVMTLFLLGLSLLLVGQMPAGVAALPPLVVSLIAVGQGEALLVEFPGGETLLVDAGDREHGEAVVAYLRERGVKRVDIFALTHPHDDHIGGAPAVLAAFPVGKVWDSGHSHGSRIQQQVLKEIRERKIRFGLPRAGFLETIGQARLEVLAPGEKLLTGTDSDANNNSLVLHLRYGATSLLLTGDMEAEEEATRAWPRCEVLKVAHHGSRSGTNRAFLTAVAPQLALISCGADNPYGHPHPETRRALAAVGVKTLVTAEDGTIQVTTDGQQITHRVLGTTETASRAGRGGQGYIGNRTSSVFHRPSCTSLPAPSNRIHFRTRAAALAAGYRPCSRCHP
jgi:competence protein ComEC